ncbi:MAG: hypothetical protein HY867_12295 [Chloroflexi bacterium]|nr:hypothetical protein [Chloroflexota bacterium]
MIYVGNHYEVKNNIVTKYYFAGTTRLAVRTDGTLRFLLGDHLGSSSVTTNASGAKTASALYKAFGETRFTSGTLSTDYKFTGQREDSALGGVYFFQSRWFDPSLGLRKNPVKPDMSPRIPDHRDPCPCNRSNCHGASETLRQAQRAACQVSART